MKALVLVLLGKSTAVPVLHYIELAAHDGLYTLVFGCFSHELKYTEHIPVIGDGEGFHAIGSGFFEQTGNRGGTIEQRELRMAVQVSKIRHIERRLVLLTPKLRESA